MDVRVRGQLLSAGANTGAGCEELQMSILFGVVYIVLWFLLVLYEHAGVEPTCGILSLPVNQAPRAGSSVQNLLLWSTYRVDVICNIHSSIYIRLRVWPPPKCDKGRMKNRSTSITDLRHPYGGVVRATKVSRHPSRCYFTLDLDSSAKLDGCESCSMMPDDHRMVASSVRGYGTCSSNDRHGRGPETSRPGFWYSSVLFFMRFPFPIIPTRPFHKRKNTRKSTCTPSTTPGFWRLFRVALLRRNHLRGHPSIVIRLLLTQRLVVRRHLQTIQPK